MRGMSADGLGREQPSMSAVPFGEAFRFWLKLGFISFGGPAGQIAIMHRELVDRRKWISEDRFLHALNYCMLLPGPEAQQLATYVGWLLHRYRGGIVAGTLFVLPSVFVLLGLSYAYAAYGQLRIVSGILSGFKPVVVAVVVEAIWKIGRRALHAPVHVCIAAAAFILIYFLRVPFPVIVLGAGAAGLVGVNLRPGWFLSRKPQRSDESSVEPATDPRTAVARSVRILLVHVLFWLVPLVLLLAWRGVESLQVQSFLFFTQAAFVTFGGAYAVLAYVSQVAVNSYSWLNPAQMVDGLALAETTPGPLIMVLQFVGFMAGWHHPGGMNPLISAVSVALLTTYATFLPCFLFIFLGAPYIEFLRGNRLLNGALSGITASVVGVILNLAVVFGTTVIWPDGLRGSVDLFAAILALCAFVALWRFQWDILRVIAAAGVIGLLFEYVRS